MPQSFVTYSWSYACVTVFSCIADGEGKMYPDRFTFCATEGKAVFASGEIKGNEGVHRLWLPVESEGQQQ